MGLYAKHGLFRRTTDADRKKVEEVLADVDMLSHKNTRISDLSGGQRQRVFLAQAIVNEPELIVLDEPTIGIDEESEARFYSLLSYFNKELKMSIILASHDLECIAKEVKQLIVVDKSLRVYNNPQEALIQEHHHFFHHHV
jgi:zinc transport system ATP-binding protein